MPARLDKKREKSEVKTRIGFAGRRRLAGLCDDGGGRVPCENQRGSGGGHFGRGSFRDLRNDRLTRLHNDVRGF